MCENGDLNCGDCGECGDCDCGDCDCDTCCVAVDDADCCSGPCDGCASCGDGCCFAAGDTLDCCSTEPAYAPAISSGVAPGGGEVAGNFIQTQPTATIIPIIYPIPVYNNNNNNNNNNNAFVFRERRRYNRHRECCYIKKCPSTRTFLTWMFAIAVIAAIGVTFWLTRNIPFGQNCGNTHRALLGVLLVIVVGGIVMPLYYKHVQHSLVRKDMQRDPNLDPTTPFHSFYIKDDKIVDRSVLASKRFSISLKLSTLVLIIVVGFGYYYLWSEENRCVDPELWIVKGWFFALLLVAIVVVAFMLAAMFRAVREKRLLHPKKRDRDEPNNNVTQLDDLNLNNKQRNERARSQLTTPSSSFSPSTSSGAGTTSGTTPGYPPAHKASSGSPRLGHKDVSGSPRLVHKEADRHSHPMPDQVEIEHTMAAAHLIQQQQEEQRHHQMAYQSHVPYGASGTGAYC